MVTQASYLLSWFGYWRYNGSNLLSPVRVSYESSLLDWLMGCDDITLSGSNLVSLSDKIHYGKCATMLGSKKHFICKVIYLNVLFTAVFNKEPRRLRKCLHSRSYTNFGTWNPLFVSIVISCRHIPDKKTNLWKVESILHLPLIWSGCVQAGRVFCSIGV